MTLMVFACGFPPAMVHVQTLMQLHLKICIYLALIICFVFKV
jgi:hypothetical protein